MKLIYVIGLLAVLVLITAQGCQKTAEVSEQGKTAETVVAEQSPVSAEEVTKETVEVQVFKMLFEPETVTIKAGDTVSWIVADESAHLLNVNGDRSLTMNKGSVWDKTFETPGTYEVFDAIFKFRGTVVVE